MCFDFNRVSVKHDIAFIVLAHRVINPSVGSLASQTHPTASEGKGLGKCLH